MSENIRFQLVRGNTAQMNQYLGREGELSVDLSDMNIRIHDGVTQGGVLLELGDVEVPVSLQQTTNSVIISVGSENVTINTATPSMVGLMSIEDKAKLDGLGNGDGVTDPTNITISSTDSAVTVISSSGSDGTINAATTSVAGVMSSTDKTKLDDVEAGAQVNTVTSVAGKTGEVVLAAVDIPNLDASKVSTGVIADARLPSNAHGTRTVSTDDPTGGVDNDIWLKY